MAGFIQLAVLALFVVFARGSEVCSWLSHHHQLAGVRLLQHFQRRHTAVQTAVGSSTLSSPAQLARMDIVGSNGSLGSAVQRSPVASRSAAAPQPDASPRGLYSSQVIQQQARSGTRSMTDIAKQEVNHEAALQRSHSLKLDEKLALLGVEQRAELNTNGSIITDLTGKAQRSPKVHDHWSRKNIIDGVCVIGALAIIFLFLVLADVV